MTKSELIQQLCTKFKGSDFSAVSCADMREAVDRILDMLADALAAGERIELRGFGSFSLHDISARQGRNPRTGESVPVPHRKAVYFRVGAELRAQVNLSVRIFRVLTASVFDAGMPGRGNAFPGASLCRGYPCAGGSWRFPSRARTPDTV